MVGGGTPASPEVQADAPKGQLHIGDLSKPPILSAADLLRRSS